jgi:uncharacterized membrane protein YkvI
MASGRRFNRVVQIGFTFIGTMVGAGFASGQEILQFFTRYGGSAVATIFAASLLFVWLGVKIMILAGRTGAGTYEELNTIIMGKTAGKLFSRFMAVVLLGTCGVMLAGAGSIFEERLGLPFVAGLLLTMLLAFWVMSGGIGAIMAVNTVIVPLMVAFLLVMTIQSFHSPNAANWIWRQTDAPLWKIWLSPLLYAAFNLSLTQAVLVPIGAAIRDPQTLRLGGIVGGSGIGLLLLAGHFALSTQMPGIAQFEIPSAHLIHSLGPVIQLLFLIVIYAEIFTTLIADAFGLSLLVQQHVRLRGSAVLLLILAIGGLISLAGFSRLVGTLYPLFGAVSLLWLLLLALWRPGEAANGTNGGNRRRVV